MCHLKKKLSHIYLIKQTIDYLPQNHYKILQLYDYIVSIQSGVVNNDMCPIEQSQSYLSLITIVQ